MTRAVLLTFLFAGSVFAQAGPNDIIEAPDHQRYSLSAYQAGHSDAERDVARESVDC
jgi:hypothetical protein